MVTLNPFHDGGDGGINDVKASLSPGADRRRVDVGGRHILRIAVEDERFPGRETPLSRCLLPGRRGRDQSPFKTYPGAFTIDHDVECRAENFDFETAGIDDEWARGIVRRKPNS